MLISLKNHNHVSDCILLISEPRLNWNDFYRVMQDPLDLLTSFYIAQPEGKHLVWKTFIIVFYRVRYASCLLICTCLKSWVNNEVVFLRCTNCSCALYSLSKRLWLTGGYFTFMLDFLSLIPSFGCLRIRTVSLPGCNSLSGLTFIIDYLHFKDALYRWSNSWVNGSALPTFFSRTNFSGSRVWWISTRI